MKKTIITLTLLATFASNAAFVSFISDSKYNIASNDPASETGQIVGGGAYVKPEDQTGGGVTPTPSCGEEYKDATAIYDSVNVGCDLVLPNLQNLYSDLTAKSLTAESLNSVVGTITVSDTASLGSAGKTYNYANFTINASNIVFNGNVTLGGSLTLNGNVSGNIVSINSSDDFYNVNLNLSKMTSAPSAKINAASFATINENILTSGVIQVNTSANSLAWPAAGSAFCDAYNNMKIVVQTTTGNPNKWSDPYCQ
ncbi:TPA: hypothetical protein NKS02_002511 [Vibrio parahaemolyticus]|nr:hypothetical protein [Vibrio parahaemolyticus]